MALNYAFRCYDSSYLKKRYNNELLTSQMRVLSVDQEVRWAYDHRFCGDDYVKYFSLAYNYVYDKLIDEEVTDHVKHRYPFTSIREISESKAKLKMFVDALMAKDPSLREVAKNLNDLYEKKPEKPVDSTGERYDLTDSPLLQPKPKPASLTSAQRVAINPLFPTGQGSKSEPDPVTTSTTDQRVAKKPLFVKGSVSGAEALRLQHQHENLQERINALKKRLNGKKGGAKKGRKSKRNKRSKNKTKRRHRY
jgi:hypothetical protein